MHSLRRLEASAILRRIHVRKPSTNVLTLPKLGALREVARDNIVVALPMYLPSVISWEIGVRVVTWLAIVGGPCIQALHLCPHATENYPEGAEVHWKCTLEVHLRHIIGVLLWYTSRMKNVLRGVLSYTYTVCTRSVLLKLHLDCLVYQKGSTPRSKCTPVLALGKEPLERWQATSVVPVPYFGGFFYRPPIVAAIFRKIRLKYIICDVTTSPLGAPLAVWNY